MMSGKQRVVVKGSERQPLPGSRDARSCVAVAVRVAIAAGLLAGCRDNEDAVLCRADVDCVDGSCVVAPVSRLQYCAEPARGCATGLRWAANAGDDLAALCVAPETAIDAGVADVGTAVVGGAP